MNIKVLKIIMIFLITAAVVYFGISYFLPTTYVDYYNSSFINVNDSIKDLSHPKDFIDTLVGMTPTHELSYDQNKFYELTNKHIAFVGTKNNENIGVIQEDGLYIDENGNYMTLQKIDIFYPEYFSPTRDYNAERKSGGRHFGYQVNADIIFYATDNVFDINTCDYEFSSAGINSKTTYVVIKSDTEVFGLITYWRRYAEIDDSIILNSILDNLIIF